MKYDDDENVEDIDETARINLMFLEIPEPTGDDEKIVEVSFSKLTHKNK